MKKSGKQRSPRARKEIKRTNRKKHMVSIWRQVWVDWALAIATEQDA